MNFSRSPHARVKSPRTHTRSLLRSPTYKTSRILSASRTIRSPDAPFHPRDPSHVPACTPHPSLPIAHPPPPPPLPTGFLPGATSPDLNLAHSRACSAYPALRSQPVGRAACIRLLTRTVRTFFSSPHSPPSLAACVSAVPRTTIRTYASLLFHTPAHALFHVRPQPTGRVSPRWPSLVVRRLLMHISAFLRMHPADLPLSRVLPPPGPPPAAPRRPAPPRPSFCFQAGQPQARPACRRGIGISTTGRAARARRTASLSAHARRSHAHTPAG